MGIVHFQSEAHNSRMRKVRNVFSASYSKYLRKVEGNLLINGGEKEKRRACIADYIVKTRENITQTIVVFSDDAGLENQLIDLANGGMIGQLYVCSEVHNNYDFFSGMPKNLVTEYFNALAVEKAVKDTSELVSYTDAFLSILSDRASVSLSSMKKFAANDDTGIAGASNTQEDSNMLISSTRGGVTYRSLLNRTNDALLPLSYKDCATGFCLKNLIKENCVVLINTPFTDYEFFSLYFATELKALVGERFVCIFDDSVMLNKGVMRSIVNIMKQRPNISVVISHGNIISVEEGEELLKNMNCDVVFLNGNTPQADMQKVLSSFGQYTHMQPMASRTTAPKLFFTPFTSDGESPMAYLRDRVIFQEEFGNEALLKDGRSADIIIARRLNK